MNQYNRLLDPKKDIGRYSGTCAAGDGLHDFVVHGFIVHGVVPLGRERSPRRELTR